MHEIVEVKGVQDKISCQYERDKFQVESIKLKTQSEELEKSYSKKFFKFKVYVGTGLSLPEDHKYTLKISIGELFVEFNEP